MLDLESLFKFSYGMYIVSSKKDGRFNGCIVNQAGEPMPYAYRRDIKRGTTPKTAATYIKVRSKTALEGAKNMKKYRCTRCGYIYDPSVGDVDNGVEAGTAFEDLRRDWVCPECGAGKDEFEPIEE